MEPLSPFLSSTKGVNPPESRDFLEELVLGRRGEGTHVSNGGPDVGRGCEWPLGSGTGQAFLL